MNLSTIVERISEKVLGSPLAVHVERELAEETLTTRRALADELAALEEAELVALRETHEPARAHALAHVDLCTRALEEAREQLVAIERTANMASFAIDSRRSQLQFQLSKTASPRIRAFERELRADLEATLAARDSVMLKNFDGKWVVVWSNASSVQARAAAITEALTTVQGLVYAPLDEPELEDRIATLRDSLPAIEGRPVKYREENVE